MALSVVGTERLQGSGYFRAKLAQEETIKAAAIPSTILRATQFFEFIGRIADSSTQDGTVALPPLYFQPEAADDVATALADIAEGAPVNGTVELGGRTVPAGRARPALPERDRRSAARRDRCPRALLRPGSHG